MQGQRRQSSYLASLFLQESILLPDDLSIPREDPQPLWKLLHGSRTPISTSTRHTCGAISCYIAGKHGKWPGRVRCCRYRNTRQHTSAGTALPTGLSSEYGLRCFHMKTLSASSGYCSAAIWSGVSPTSCSDFAMRSARVESATGNQGIEFAALQSFCTHQLCKGMRLSWVRMLIHDLLRGELLCHTLLHHKLQHTFHACCRRF